jgi:hypothetical protein
MRLASAGENRRANVQEIASDKHCGAEHLAPINDVALQSSVAAFASAKSRYEFGNKMPAMPCGKCGNVPR